ncbi:MAG: protein kinase [Planctomycetaceae bacterium]|nr:protein kinase [Planctomycetaceae bacterium]
MAQPSTQETIEAKHVTEGRESGPPRESNDADGRAEAALRKLDRYEIVRKLGRGGMGAVYQARDKQLDRLVAIKVPFTEYLDSGLRERFFREARASAAVSHRGICQVHDIGSTDGYPYLTMAFIEGETLAARIARVGRIPLDESVRIVAALGEALDAAHAAGIIHRDLKPANIMIDRRGEPILMDFGLARRTLSNDVALTQSGEFVGTPAYMAPEQFSSDPGLIGPPTDVYSLGVVFFEMTTGRRPFTGDLTALIAGSLHSIPPAPRELCPDIPDNLSSVCLKALAKKPGDRFASASAFTTALRRSAKEDELPATVRMIAASPPAVPEGTARRWWIGGVVALLAGVLLAAGGFSGGGTGNDNDRKDGGSSGAAQGADGGRTAPTGPATKDGGSRVRIESFSIHLQRANEKSGFRVLQNRDLPLRDNDKVQLHIALEREGYLCVHWFDGQGKPTRVYPERLDRQTKVKELWLPPLATDGELQEWFVMGGAKGLEMAFCGAFPSEIDEPQLKEFEERAIRFGRRDDAGRVVILSPVAERGVVGTVKTSKKAESKTALVLVPPDMTARLHLLRSTEPDSERGIAGTVKTSKAAGPTDEPEFVPEARRKFPEFFGIVFPHD